MATALTSEQRAVCQRFGVEPQPVAADGIVGVSLSLRSSLVPVNGLRHPPTPQASGWYVWAGEVDPSTQGAHFFVPLHAEHLPVWRPEVLPFLALPPGWRFLLGPEYEDGWRDETLLDVD